MRKMEYTYMICTYCRQEFSIPNYVLRKRLKAGIKKFYCGVPCKHADIQDVKQRFWQYVEKRGDADCWNWQAGKDKDGYGLFTCTYAGKHRSIRAHRFSYMLENGELLDTLMVCHSFDNPSCVNPAHLWAGTHLENQQDMARKNRYGTRPAASGVRNITAKLSEQDVRDLRNSVKLGVPTRVLACLYSITTTHVRNIARRMSWKNVEDSDAVE